MTKTVVDLTSSPEPESLSPRRHSCLCGSRPLQRIHLPGLPSKRRKLSHTAINDNDDDHDDEDVDALLSRFQARTTPLPRQDPANNQDRSSAIPPPPATAPGLTERTRETQPIITQRYPDTLPVPPPATTELLSNRLVSPRAIRTPSQRAAARPVVIDLATPPPFPDSHAPAPVVSSTTLLHAPPGRMSQHPASASHSISVHPAWSVATSARRFPGTRPPRPVASSMLYGSPVKRDLWTPEEECVIIYLKRILNWRYEDIIRLLDGRSSGAASTRFCNHLKYRNDMEQVIAVIRNSKWAHILPQEHNSRIPAHPPSEASALAADPKASSAPTPLLKAGPTIASLRPRRAIQKRTNYDNNDSAEISDEASLPRNPSPKTHVPAEKRVAIGIVVEGKNTHKDKTFPLEKASFPYRPYLCHHQRLALEHGFDGGEWQGLNSWKGTEVHVPFTRGERQSLDYAIASKFGPAVSSIHIKPSEMTEPEILEVASLARPLLPTRTRNSIEAFLRDVVNDTVSKPEALCLGRRMSLFSRLASMIRNRELGMRTSHIDYSKRGVSHYKTPIVESIGPSLSFTGTSGDVNTVAWSSNGTQFAAGSTCLVDAASMQYNRPNNLLFGDVPRKVLYEIADHCTERKRPEHGANSTFSMHVTQDPRLFQTISMVAFSPDGSLLYTAGYDNFVRIYTVSGTGQPELHCPALRHKAKVDLLSVSRKGLLATACQRSDKNSIRVINPYHCSFRPSEPTDEDANRQKTIEHSLFSRKATYRPDDDIFPSALRFDPSGDYLLAGFASTSKNKSISGDTCLWDVRTGAKLSIFPETRTVFDVAWMCNQWGASSFAVGCVAGSSVNRGIRSVIKMYDVREDKCNMPLELDCPALDMNDVLFCPYDDHLVAAGCTNGKTYIWDVRRPRPHDHLYALMHGEPSIELGDNDPASRERLDTGVRFCSWGHDHRRLYTGSSDGVVKVWDPYRAPEDVFTEDVVQLNSGIMSGQFSLDHCSLLLGEVNGTINVLEAGQSDRCIKDMDSFDLIPYKESERPEIDSADDRGSIENKDSGIVAARDLLRTNQMVLRQMGSLPILQAVQGPAYNGPYDHADDAADLRAVAARAQLLHAAPVTPQCNLAACYDAAFSKVVPEEAGDSGRSADRIPGALRSLGDGSLVATGIASTLRCAECHVRPARVRAQADAAQGAPMRPLCERCNFACPRCGCVADLLSSGTGNDAVAGVLCLRCRALWRVDLLGYKLVYESHDAPSSAHGAQWDPHRDERFLYERAKILGVERDEHPLPPSAPPLDPATDCLRVDIGTVEDDTRANRRTKGHEYLAAEGEDCIKEYYHSLWQDRPASPL